MLAFNAPYSMSLLEIDNVGMLDTEAESQGKVFVSSELGGGGTATASSIAIARKGIRNLLIHSNILQGRLVVQPSVRLDMSGDDCFLFAQHSGLIEYCVDLGQRVVAEQIVARIWPVDRTGAMPIEYHFKRSGLFVSRHFPGLVQSGDCLAVVATSFD